MTYKFCKHCKCRATPKVGFYTNHSSSGHTFPCNKSTPDTSAEDSLESDAIDATAPTGSHSAVEEIFEEGGELLTWEGFMSPMEDQPDKEATTELIVMSGSGTNEDEMENGDDKASGSAPGSIQVMVEGLQRTVRVHHAFVDNVGLEVLPELR